VGTAFPHLFCICFKMDLKLFQNGYIFGAFPHLVVSATCLVKCNQELQDLPSLFTAITNSEKLAVN